MPDTNTPLRRDDLDEREQRDIEARMRLALERLGSEAGSRRDSPGRSSVAPQAASSRRGAAAHPPSSARRITAGVLTLPASPARQDDALGRDLAEEQAARQRAEQALLDAQAIIGQLQAALAECEQARDAALASGRDKDATITTLQAELQQQAVQTEAAAAATAEQGTQDETSSIVSGAAPSGSMDAPAGTGKPKRRPRAATHNKGPQPVKWWLAHAKKDG